MSGSSDQISRYAQRYLSAERDVLVSTHLERHAWREGENLTFNRLRCFYLTIDIIRSIHFHRPSTVDPGWLIKAGTNGTHNLSVICEKLIQDKCRLPLDLTTDEYLLLLMCLLSAINTLLCSLGPLTSSIGSIRAKAKKLFHEHVTTPRRPEEQHTRKDTEELMKSRSMTLEYNLHIPLTSDREYNVLKYSLEQSLEVWQLSSQNREATSDATEVVTGRSFLPLFEFAKLLLESGPAIYLVPSLAGYNFHTPSTLASHLTQPCPPHRIGIHFSDRSVQLAIAILEHIEEKNEGFERFASKPHRLSPMWYPLILFYGGLVIWSRAADDSQGKHRGHLVISPRKLLHDFLAQQEKLKKEWSCAKQMAQVMKNLIDQTS